MKSSCHFLFNRLGMPTLQNSTQFSNSISSLVVLDSVVLCSTAPSKSQRYVTTDGQSASLSWCQAPIWDLRPDFYFCQTTAGLLMWGALSAPSDFPSVINLRHGPHRNHLSSTVACVFIGTLPSIGHPIAAYSLPRDVFTGSLPSNG
jgi:hypothetical protein